MPDIFKRQVAARILAKWPGRWREFVRDRRGNVAIITAIAALPMIATMGCMVDFTIASMVKVKLANAADAAALATVSSASPVVATAKANNSVSNGKAFADNFFNAIANGIIASFKLSVTETSTVTLSSRKVTATVSFTGTYPTYFLGLIGKSTIGLSGSSTAAYTLPANIDFYLMIDVSGSMGMPSTNAEQVRLQSVNPDNLSDYPSGCTFACHFSGNQGFQISRIGTTPANISTGTYPTNSSRINWSATPVSSCATAGTTSCIQLRADAVGYAVTSLLAQANTTQTNTGTPNQFRVGIYPFIQYLCSSSIGGSNSCSVGLTTSLTGSTITNFAAQLANLLDTGANATLGSGGTHYENALNKMLSTVLPSSGGTGSSGNPLTYLFIIGDGSQDYQTQWNGNWSSQNWSPNASVPYQNSATVIPPNSVDSTDYCGQIKARGVTISVLYIPYQTIGNANASFASNEDGYANANIPNIPAALQACASPNFFFTASTPAAIQSALLTMFQQAVSTAHISQ